MVPQNDSILEECITKLLKITLSRLHPSQYSRNPVGQRDRYRQRPWGSQDEHRDNDLVQNIIKDPPVDSLAILAGLNENCRSWERSGCAALIAGLGTADLTVHGLAERASRQRSAQQPAAVDVSDAVTRGSTSEQPGTIPQISAWPAGFVGEAPDSPGATHRVRADAMI